MYTMHIEYILCVMLADYDPLVRIIAANPYELHNYHLSEHLLSKQ